MGEMADFLLDQYDDHDERAGCCGYDDVMYEEETDSYYGSGHRKPLYCKFCKAGPLEWMRTSKRWIICEQDGSVHDCPKNPLSLQILKEIASERFPKPMKTDSIPPTGMPFDNYVPPSWDEWFMKIMYVVASKSKDPKTKIGAVLVRERRIISTGYNGLCRGVNDTIPERLVRPAKYNWFEHGERNAIFAAARYGIATEDTVMYTNGIPCTDCARAVIQAGIRQVIVHKPYEDLCIAAQKTKLGHGEQWKGHNEISMAMFDEAGVMVVVLDKPIGAFAYFDGNQYVV